MKIKTRLFLGFSSIAIIISFMGLFTYYTYIDLIEVSSYHANVGYPATVALKDIKVKLLESESWALKYLTTNDDVEKQRYLQTKSEMNLLLTKYESIIDAKSNKKNTFLAGAEIYEARRNLLDDIINSSSEYYSLVDEISALQESGQRPYEIKENRESIKNQEVISMESVEHAYKVELDYILQKQSELDKINQNYITYSTTFVGFLISSIFGIGFLISNSISKPLIELENSIQKTVLEGMQEPLLVKGDEEIKNLIQSFNDFGLSLKKLDLMKDKEFHSVKDITDLKHALDSSSNVTITDTDGTIIYVNDKFCKISKYSENELIGQNHRLLKSGYHPPSFYKKMWEDISNGFIWKGDVKNKAKDGSFYWVRTTIVPILNKTEKPHQYIAIRYDITQQKDAEERLNDVLIQLKKNDKLKDEFASMVTHELKTPLTPIKGYCEMLRIPELMGTLNNEQLQSIKEIEENARKLELLIGDVLDAQKLDMKKMSFKKTEFSTDEFMNVIFKNAIHLMKDKNINFVNKTEKFSIVSDKDRLTQVMTNLISNAVDFVPKNDGKIEIGTKKEGFEVIFYVKDNGIGITKDKQEDLFKKFYQVDTTATRHHGGTGLGLTICKGIVEGLGGKIWLESDLEKGTTFYFSVLKGDGSENSNN